MRPPFITASSATLLFGQATAKGHGHAPLIRRVVVQGQSVLSVADVAVVLPGTVSGMAVWRETLKSLSLIHISEPTRR